MVKTRTIPYHPISNGLTERLNSAKISMIQKAVSEEEYDWDGHLSKLLQSKQFMHAPLTSKFLVQPSNAECRGLETTYKDLRQMFQHSDRMFEQIFQISFKISFGT